ncbi:hypothetical protein P9112_014006 [Eukaryota sp. TZLM1-RC]
MYIDEDLSALAKARRMLHMTVVSHSSPSHSDIVAATIHFLQSTTLFSLVKAWLVENPQFETLFQTHLGSWLIDQEHCFKTTLAKLNEDRQQSLSTMISEHIRQTSLARAHAFLSVGNLDSAYLVLQDLRDNLGSLSTTVEILVLLCVVCCHLSKFSEALVHIERCRVLIKDHDSKDSYSFADSISKLDLLQGFSYFNLTRFEESLPLLLKSVAEKSILPDLVSATEIAKFVVVGGLLNCSSDWLTINIVENSALRYILGEDELFSNAVINYCALSFPTFLESVRDLSESFTFNLFLFPLKTKFSDLTFRNAIRLLLSCFNSLSFNQLSELLGFEQCEFLLNYCQNLCQQGFVPFKLSSIDDVIYFERSDVAVENTAIKEALGSVDFCASQLESKLWTQMYRLQKEKDHVTTIL